MKKILLGAVLAASMLAGCATVQQPTKPITEPMMIAQSPNGPGYVALTLRTHEQCRDPSKVAFIKYNDGEREAGCYVNDGETVIIDSAKGRATLPINLFRYVEVPMSGQE